MEDRKKHIITGVKDGSIASELALEPGDKLLTVNGEPIQDIFDYRFQINDEFVTLLVEKTDGDVWELEVEKEADEDLGLDFSSGLMDDYRSCCNHCVFCFIDQMPPGMRPTLYFKDDDSRLSFLQGNYVTLTNMSEDDISRVIRYRLEPINISVHTTNPVLRCQMLHNRFAGKALEKIHRLYEAGIQMNGQIVLCKGINDQDELERSLKDLEVFAPVMQSVSIVPVGLTKYREGLYPLKPFQTDDAKALIRQVETHQQRMLSDLGIHFVHASDEWYLLAGEEMPPAKSYDGYPQLENGVGMLRLLEEEFTQALKNCSGDRLSRKATIATGRLAAPFLERFLKALNVKFPETQIRVIPIRNDFFGEAITVSGLVTGQDLAAQLYGKDLGERLLLPCNMLRSQEDVFLDDMTVKELSHKLGLPITIVGSSGEDLLHAICSVTGKKEITEAAAHDVTKRRQMYEQTSGGDRGKTKCGEIHPV